MSWLAWLLSMLLTTIRGLLATVMTIVLFVGVVSVLLLVALGRGPGEVAVPNVVNMDQDEAQQAMTDAGLRLDVSREIHSTDVEDGCIVETRPAAGKVTRAGRKVFAVVSLGSEKATVPKVVGHSSTAAQERIREAKLRVGVVVYRADSNPRDHVLEQSPASGTTIARNQPVNLILSGGSHFGRHKLSGGRTLLFRTAKLKVPQGEPLQRVVVKVVASSPDVDKVFYSRVHRPGDEVTTDFYAPEGGRLQVLVDNESVFNEKI